MNTISIPTPTIAPNYFNAGLSPKKWTKFYFLGLDKILLCNNLIVMKRLNRTSKGRDSHRCESGKVRYRDKTEAVEYLHRVKNKAQYQMADFGASKRQESRSYFCAQCKGWHLTSMSLDLYQTITKGAKADTSTTIEGEVSPQGVA